MEDSPETRRTTKEVQAHSPIHQHPWVVDPYCDASLLAESRFLRSYKGTKQASLAATDGLVAPEGDRNVMREEDCQEDPFSPSAATTNRGYLKIKDSWKPKVHPDMSTLDSMDRRSNRSRTPYEAWNQPAGDNSFGIMDPPKPRLQEEEPVFNDYWATGQQQPDLVTRSNMQAQQTEIKKSSDNIPSQYKSRQRYLSILEKRKRVSPTAKSASLVNRPQEENKYSQPDTQGSLASPAGASPIASHKPYHQPTGRAETRISPSTKDTKITARVKSPQLDSQHYHRFIKETNDESTKPTPSENSTRASTSYTNDSMKRGQDGDQITGFDERNNSPTRGISIESTGIDTDQMKRQSNEPTEMEEGSKSPPRDTRLASKSSDSDIVNMPQLDEQNGKQLHVKSESDEGSACPSRDTRRASSGTGAFTLDNLPDKDEGSKASAGIGTTDEPNKQVISKNTDEESEGDTKLPPKNSRRRVSFGGLDVEIVAKSPRERAEDELDSMHSRSEYSRWDDESQALDDTGHDSFGYDSVYDQDLERLSVTSLTRPKHRSLGRATKRIAMNVARQPKKLVKTVARQPKKLANGVRKRRTRNNSTGGSNEVLETGHLSPDEYVLIDATLEKNFLFRELYEGALHTLILAFEKVVVPKGHAVIRQGEDSELDHFVYVVAEGECSVAVDGVQVPGPYGTFGPKSIFGELGVLHNTTRAATISAKTDSVVLFRASGAAFHNSLSLMPDGGDDKVPVDMRDIDRAIDQLSGTKSLHGGEIMRQYQPDRLWLWSQWHGTILEQNLLPTIVAMLVSGAIIAIIGIFGEPTWEIGQVPDQEHYIIQHLALVNGVWSYTMTLTTFILTFYVNQGFWTDTNTSVRQIQGRMGDFMISLSTHAKRNDDGSYTPEAEAIIDEVGASARIFHCLFWSSCARRFQCLATPVGMKCMAERGMMTPKQLQILQSLHTPYGTKHVACLEWMMITASQGMEDGCFRNSYALSRQLLETTCQLRSVSVRVVDSLKSGRPPLSYTHLVQVLVDCFIWTSPLALYAELGIYSILCVGLIALFYGGLLNMAKNFLDPLGNQHFTKSSINMGMDIGVLTRESNASTVLFKEHGAKVPL